MIIKDSFERFFMKQTVFHLPDKRQLEEFMLKEMKEMGL